MPVVECDVVEARNRLTEAGANVTDGNTEHERWRGTLGEATAVAYDGKVVIQGARPRDIEAVLREGGGRVHLYVDGASRGNPGPAAIAWVLVAGEGGIVAEHAERIGQATNNQAEYLALIAGLRAARDYGYDTVHARGDSELVVKQVHGEWDANDPTLREHRVTVRELLTDFDDWELTHVPRELNERADSLANDALDAG